MTDINSFSVKLACFQLWSRGPSCFYMSQGTTQGACLQKHTHTSTHKGFSGFFFSFLAWGREFQWLLWHWWWQFLLRWLVWYWTKKPWAADWVNILLLSTLMLSPLSSLPLSPSSFTGLISFSVSLTLFIHFETTFPCMFIIYIWLFI